jgi:hypothetical protein
MDIKEASGPKNVKIVGDGEDVSGAKRVEASNNGQDATGTTDPALTKDVGFTDHSASTTGDQQMSKE